MHSDILQNQVLNLSRALAETEVISTNPINGSQIYPSVSTIRQPISPSDSLGRPGIGPCVGVLCVLSRYSCWFREESDEAFENRKICLDAMKTCVVMPEAIDCRTILCQNHEWQHSQLIICLFHVIGGGTLY